MAEKKAEKPVNQRSAPWAIRGVSPEAQNAARLAAQRAGVTLGQWVDRTIMDAAAGELTRKTVPAPTEADTLKAILERMERRDQAIEELAGQVRQLQEKRRGWLSRMFGG